MIIQERVTGLSFQDFICVSGPYFKPKCIPQSSEFSTMCVLQNGTTSSRSQAKETNSKWSSWAPTRMKMLSMNTTRRCLGTPCLTPTEGPRCGGVDCLSWRKQPKSSLESHVKRYKGIPSQTGVKLPSTDCFCRSSQSFKFYCTSEKAVQQVQSTGYTNSCVRRSWHRESDHRKWPRKGSTFYFYRFYLFIYFFQPNSLAAKSPLLMLQNWNSQ